MYKIKTHNNGDTYIVTYTTDYPEDDMDYVLELLYDDFSLLYKKKILGYGNVCGTNAENVCNILIEKDAINYRGLLKEKGKIIITDWDYSKPATNIDTISSVYGRQAFVIQAHYHALAYVEINLFDDPSKYFYCAIETTSCVPYKLQFYIGNSKEDLREILKIRYQCNDVNFTKCDTPWHKFRKGGKKRTKNYKKNYKKTYKKNYKKTYKRTYKKYK